MGLIKTEVYLIFSFIIFLIIVIVSGRILNEINLSKCNTDKNIKIAHKWATWAVGISAAMAGLSLIAFIALMFI